MAGLWSSWFVRLCLMGMLLAAVKQGLITSVRLWRPKRPWPSAGSLVGRVKVLKTLGLLPTHWQSETRALGLVPDYWQKAGSWSLAAGHRV